MMDASCDSIDEIMDEMSSTTEFLAYCAKLGEAYVVTKKGLFTFGLNALALFFAILDLSLNLAESPSFCTATVPLIGSIIMGVFKPHFFSLHVLFCKSAKYKEKILMVVECPI